MTVRNSQFGHDIAGDMTTNQSILNMDEGEAFFDVPTNQWYVCKGAGVLIPIGSGGNVPVGGAGSVNTIRKLLTGMTDATFTTLCTLTIPNGIMGGSLKVMATGILGDGDSSQTAEYLVAISRITGATTGVTAGSAIGATTNNGVTGNAALAIQAVAPVGAVGATQTVAIQMSVTRSAGTSGNHVLVASIELANGFANGITVA